MWQFVHSDSIVVVGSWITLAFSRLEMSSSTLRVCLGLQKVRLADANPVVWPDFHWEYVGYR